LERRGNWHEAKEARALLETFEYTLELSKQHLQRDRDLKKKAG